MECSEGVHYNAYYKGGLIAMAQALYDDIIEYEDGKFVILIVSTILECSEGVHHKTNYKDNMILLWQGIVTVFCYSKPFIIVSPAIIAAHRDHFVRCLSVHLSGSQKVNIVEMLKMNN